MVSTVCVVYLKFHVRAGLSGSVQCAWCISTLELVSVVSTVCMVYLKFHVRAGLSGQYSVGGVSDRVTCVALVQLARAAG